MTIKDFAKLAKDFKICVAEDEEQVREDLETILSLVFKNVETAKNGLEALEKLKKDHFDILLTDITMPKMDGFELIKQIKKINPEQKIIIVSAQNMPEFLL